MRKPFVTAFKVSGYVVAVLMTLPVFLGDKDIVSAFGFALVLGVPAWLAMWLALGFGFWLTCKPEKVKTKPVRIRTYRPWDERTPTPEEVEAKRRKPIDINFGGC